MPNRKILSVLISCLLILPTSSIARDLEKEQKAAKWNDQGIAALNKNEYLEAIDYFQRALQILPDNGTIRKNLALTYNNYAISLPGEEGKRYLYKAIELEKDNHSFKENLANIISNLATQYYKDGDYELALSELKESISILPKHIPSLILLGQIHYQMQELDKAQEIWEKAYSYDPRNTELKQMLARLRDEKKVETELKQLDAYYFDIRFDKEAVETEIYDIRYFLQEAYRDVGRDFNHYPQNKIPVILYTQEDFQRIRQTPDWVAGIYDGKIRLPVKKGEFTDKEFKRLLWHEYTHAIVYYLTDGNCPVWFNEGLAKYEELKHNDADLTLLKNAIKEDSLIPLNKLTSNFSLQNSPERLALAYLEAYSFIEFVLDRWSFYVIKGVLEKLKQGRSLEEAFSEETSRSMDRLEKDWREYLHRI